jgi:Putative phage tail protein
VWTWDARPFPAFPLNSDVWGDGSNWLTGHWLNGRLSGVPLELLAKAILAEHGIDDVDCSHVEGFVSGYVLNGQTTAREALDELLRLYRVEVSEDGGTVVLRSQRVVAPVVDIDDPVVGQKDSRKSTVRSDNSEVPRDLTLMFRDEFRDFQQSSVLSRISKGEVRSATIEIPAVIDTAIAEAELRQLHRQMVTAQERIIFRAGWGDSGLMPGDIVRPFDGSVQKWRVRKIVEGESREIEAESFVTGGKVATRSSLPGAAVSQIAMSGLPWSAFMDLPSLPQSPALTGLRIAAWAKPWTPVIALSSPGTAGYAERLLLPTAAVAGALVSPLEGGKSGRWDKISAIDVQLFSGSLTAADELLVLGGANAAAVQSANGQWEVIQFKAASETSPGVWRLTELLRGQLGTGDAALSGAAAGSEFVLLDSAVLSAGLTSEESGLTLNWKIGPQGKDFTDRYFDTVTAGPAKRYAKSYAPAHLLGRKLANGDFSVLWVRRSRTDADSWDAAEVPLPEGQESYRVRVLDGTNAVKRELVSTTSVWAYTDAQQFADFGAGPDVATIEICQIGSDGLAGIAANLEIVIS